MAIRAFPKGAHVAFLLINFEMLLQKVSIFMVPNFDSIIALLLEKLGIPSIKVSVHVSRVIEI